MRKNLDKVLNYLCLRRVNGHMKINFKVVISLKKVQDGERLQRI